MDVYSAVAAGLYGLAVGRLITPDSVPARGGVIRGGFRPAACYAFAVMLLSESRTQSRLESFAYVVSFSILMGLLARLTVPLPFTPVPLTGQTLGVLLAGLLLGPSRGALAMLLYLAEGAAGLPVFSPAGPGGLAQLFGPTGGFLMSYPLAAFVIGYLALRLRLVTLALLAGLAVIFGFGAAWLAIVVPRSRQALLAMAVWPFLPGELLKVLAAFGLSRFLRAK